MTGDLPQLGEQGLPAFIVIVDDQRRGDGFKLIVQRQCGVATGRAHRDQIRHLGGHRFGAWFADVQPRQLAGFGNLAPLAQKARLSATRLFGVVAPLATTGASIASSEPVSVTLVETMRSG